MPISYKRGNPEQRRGELAARFWSRVKIGHPSSCWEWTGNRTLDGYGVCSAGGHRAQTASRIAYELTHGAIPDGLVIMHQCDNPPCVNPSHLRAGTDLDNSRDMMSKGRHTGRRRGVGLCEVLEYTPDTEASKPLAAASASEGS